MTVMYLSSREYRTICNRGQPIGVSYPNHRFQRCNHTDKSMKTICDMCGKAIKNKRCKCGEWGETKDDPNKPLADSLEHFHKMERFSLTGEMPHLGCAVVFFRGDYLDCKAVEQFLHKRKGRPYYEE